MTMTLEPCPFCGSADVEAYPADRDRTRWNVCCGNPGCVTRGDNDYLLQSDAIAAWNRRAHLNQPAQSVDVEDVRTLLECIECDHGGDHFEAYCKYCAAFDRLTAALQGKGKQ